MICVVKYVVSGWGKFLTSIIPTKMIRIIYNPPSSIFDSIFQKISKMAIFRLNITQLKRFDLIFNDAIQIILVFRIVPVTNWLECVCNHLNTLRCAIFNCLSKLLDIFIIVLFFHRLPSFDVILVAIVSHKMLP